MHSTPPTDWQLLRDYVERNSQPAFAALVERHVNFVYATCRREVRDEALAQDVTQVVFLILARKAASISQSATLRQSATLSGWLFKTARFAARNALAQERRRLRGEQVLMQNTTPADFCVPGPGQDHAQAHALDEQLNAALSSLNAEQRAVIILRFFEGKSVRETGAALGITEKAAERRLARALEKMRSHFAAHGCALSLATLPLLLAENAAQAAPAPCMAASLSLAGQVTSGGGVAASAGASASASAAPQVTALSQGVLKAMLFSQIKTGIVASLCVAALSVPALKMAQNAVAAPQKNAAPNAVPSAVSQHPAVAKPRTVSQTRTAAKPQMPLPMNLPVFLQNSERNSVSFRPQRSGVEESWEVAGRNPDSSTPSAQGAPTPVGMTNCCASQQGQRFISGFGKRSVLGFLENAPRRLAQAPKPAATKPAAPATKPAAPATKPAAAEIALEGTISALGNGQLVLEATSFALPGGKQSVLNPPRPKIIFLSDKTVLRVRGEATAVPLSQIKIGTMARVSGPDKGNGEALTAREVAVWDEVQNGVYLWQAPPSADAAELADIPPDASAGERANLLPQGDFEKREGRHPVGWAMQPGVRAALLQNQGKSWLKIASSDTKNWATVSASVPLKPQWKTVRVAALCKTRNLQRGATWWHTGRVDFNFFNDKGQMMAFGRGLNLYEDSGWTRLSKTMKIPEGAHSLKIEAGLFHALGDFSLDEVRVEADAPLEGMKITPELPEGGFEKIGEDGNPLGWVMWVEDKARVVRENGNSFMRFSNTTPRASAGAEAVFQLPQGWKSLRVRARMRVQNLGKGAGFWEDARLGIGMLNQFGERAGADLAALNLTKDSDWATLESVVPIPPDATLFKLQPGLYGSTGVFDIDDIRLEDASEVEPPSLPILPVMAGGFEELDADGWAKGWAKTGANAEKIKILEENGNRFMRLSNPEIIYMATKARFKLPAGWRAVTIRGRLRVKNLMRRPDAKEYQTARVGFSFQNAQGAMTGGFQPSLQTHADTDWKEFSLKSELPRDAVFIELSPTLQNCGGVFDVDDLRVEEAKSERPHIPLYQWTREFPEGTFEHRDADGGPLGWSLRTGVQIATEEGNRFLRLANERAQGSVSLSSDWLLKPQWKEVRVLARLRGTNLKPGAHPLDGARLQVLFLSGNGEVLQPIPPPLTATNGEWREAQAKFSVPPGAAIIRLLPSLSQTTGTLDLDDVLISPVTTP